MAHIFRCLHNKSILFLTSICLIPLSLYGDIKENQPHEEYHAASYGSPDTNLSQETGRTSTDGRFELIQDFFAEKATWLVDIHIAARNDLLPFAWRNIEQMKQVGSNEKVHIVVHFHFHPRGQEKKTKRLYIERNRAIQVGPDLCKDSGDPETLIDETCWAIDHFPAHHHCVILWNHGLGALNPFLSKSVNPSPLFFYNTQTQKIELDRSITFSDFVYATTKSTHRGVCFDDTTGNYLNDQKLQKAMAHIHEHRGKPIDLILFDACLMACTETAWLIHEHADYMGASQEVVLGPGYNYFLTLRKLRDQYLSPQAFLHHVIHMYRQTYSRITNDYTHSGFALDKFATLHTSLDQLAQHLIDGLERDQYMSVRRALRESSAPKYCTHFDEPTHIDLDHFLTNLQGRCDNIVVSQNSKDYVLKLRMLIAECRKALKAVITQYVAGSHFRHTSGISIYYPQMHMHASYPYTEFARHNAWLQLLQRYISPA